MLVLGLMDAKEILSTVGSPFNDISSLHFHGINSFEAADRCFLFSIVILLK